MSKKKSRKRMIIWIVVLVILAFVVYGYIGLRNNIAELAKTTYAVVDVERGTIEVRVKGAGAVESLYDNTVYASFSGTVDDVLAENGDVVSEGDIIATFTSDTLDTERETLEQQIDDIDAAISTLRSTTGSAYIMSPVEGNVKAVYAAVGDTVDVVMAEYDALAVICPDDLMQTVIPYSADLALGEKVTVTVDTQSVQGEVYSIDAAEAEIRFEDGDFAVGDTAVVSAAEGADLGEGIVSVANPVYITGEGGVIEKIYENTGDSVSRGGKMFRLDGEILSAGLYAQIGQRKEAENDLEEVLSKLDALVVRAEMDGVISGLSLNRDQVVQEGAALFAIESNAEVKIDVEIDELDIADITLGDEASVTFDALPGQEFTAAVVRINPVGVSENNVTNFTITLELSNVEGVMLGMSADVEIVSDIAENVLIIPIEAIQIIDQEKYVVFEQDINEELQYTPATHKIVTGITDGVNIEVLEGLSEGDRVAVPQVGELSLQEQQIEMMSNFRE
ncbi:MAG: HlyD family efflux transporter periplasmic adaptor subunit [Eubacteriales bacterium]|nr:HlyD family efflux transporter periplasmic adaptor subunit [Eubacteriales bacterium]